MSAKRTGLRYFCSFVLLLLLLVTVTSVAQTSNGTIAGVVADPDGAVIQNASVTVTNKDNGEKHVATTNSFGAYRIESVTPGLYTIQIKAENFAELKLQDVVVTASVVTTADGRLKIGSSETVVEINAIGQQLQTESGELSHNISTAEITDLVVPNLNPIELVMTEPGVSRPGNYGFSNGFNFSVNGTRPRANNFLIEGSDNNDTAIQGQAFQTINLEAIKEVSIQTNAYAAEFGHGGGSVSNEIYKSGTNAWHGSAFDLIQNSALDSNDAQSNLNQAPRPISRENTFGFSIGGPIKHDKLFIFGSSQWDKTRQSTTGNPLSIPTPAGFATLEALQAATPSANLARYLRALGNLRAIDNPLTNNSIALGNNRGSVTTGNLERFGGSPSNDTQLVIKADYLPSSKDTLTLRYTYDTVNASPIDLNSLPDFDAQVSGPSYNAGITETHLFSPRVVNELRLSSSRISFAFTDLNNPLTLGPQTSISGLSGFGANGLFPQGRTHDTYQYQDSVSWNTGKHSFKFGVDLTQIKVVDQIPFNTFGSISYVAGGPDPAKPGASFTGLANFIDDFSGLGGSVSRAFGSPVARPQYFYQNYYAQDTWKMKSNLSVDLGIRYEYGGTPENNLLFPSLVPVQGFNGASSINFVPQKPSKNNWGPRAGFAYTPHFWSGLFGQDKTVIHAGFGVFFDSFFTNIIDNSAASSPNAVAPLLVGGAGRGLAAASTQFAALNSTPNPRTAVTSIISDLKAPTTLQWNFNIQRDLGAKFTLTASYVGTRGEHLFTNDQLNPGVDPGNPALPAFRLDPNLGSIQVRDNNGDSIYHALDLKLDRRFSNGLLVRSAYTFSKFIDDASEVFATTGQSSLPANQILGNRGLERGLSAYNHTHVASVTFIYDIPRLKNESGLLKGLGYITNGWQTSGTYEYQTGAPNTVTDGFDANRDLTAGNDRPSLGNPNAPLSTYAIDGGNFKGGTPGVLCDGPSHFSGLGCIPVAASSVHFIIPANGIGNLGRNTQVDPGQQNTTFGLQRSFNLYSEKHQLAFRMEMLNPFNHPNTGTASFSLIGIPVPAPDVTSPFGNYAQSITGSRIIRFRMRYSF